MNDNLLNSQWIERKDEINRMKGNDNLPASPRNAHQPVISWDIGTAYDLFISLYVLHHPEKFGLRAPWAAGVRSRLNSRERSTLEIAQDMVYIPFHWISTLPSQKDGESVLWGIKQ